MLSIMSSPRARRALLLVSLLAAAGCVTFASRSRDEASSAPSRAGEPLRAAPPIACPKPAGAARDTTVAEGDPEARAGAQRGLGFVAHEAEAWQEKNKCYGCHVQAVTLEALSIGAHNQYEIPRADMEAIVAGLTTINGGARGPNGLSVGGGTEPDRDLQGVRRRGVRPVRRARGPGPARRPDERRRPAHQVPGRGRIAPHEQSPLPRGDRARCRPRPRPMQTWRQAFERIRRRALARADAQGGGLPPGAGEEARRGRGGDHRRHELRGHRPLERGGAGERGHDGRDRRAPARAAARGRRLRLHREGRASSAFATGQTLYALRLLGAGDEDTAVARGTGWLL